MSCEILTSGFAHTPLGIAILSPSANESGIACGEGGLFACGKGADFACGGLKAGSTRLRLNE